MGEDFTKKTIELKDKLSELSSDINRLFKDNAINKINEPLIREKLDHFAKTEIIKINSSIQDAIKTLESPIYIGLIGHYSHGKTALINAIFSINDEFTLPEGKGIVTSKVTHVEFDSTVSTVKCFEQLKTGERKAVNISYLRSSVSGKTTDDNSNIDYYEMILPAEKEFAKLFADRKIKIIDMPGVGGLYIKDTEKTRKYLKNFDMLIVVIKITEIETSGKVLLPFLVDISVPLLPVLTFFDEARKSNKYIDCSNDEEILIRAHKTLDESLPNLTKAYKFQPIAVSSTEGIGIDILRETILNFVSEQRFAIEKIKTQKPEVYKRKIREIMKQFDNIISVTYNSIKTLEKDITSIVPQREKFLSFSQHFKKKQSRLFQDFKKDIRKTISEIFYDIEKRNDELRTKTTQEEINTFITKLKDYIRLTSINKLEKDINSYFSDIKERISDEIDKYIDKLDMDTAKKDELKETIQDFIANQNINLKKLEFSLPNIDAKFLACHSKQVWGAILKQIKDPNFIMSIGVGIALINLNKISILEKLMSWLGKLFGVEDISALGYIIIIGTVIYAVILDRNEYKKHFENTKNDIIDTLREYFEKKKNEMDEIIYYEFEEHLNRMLIDIDEELNISDYAKDLKIIKEISREFNKQIEGFSRFLSMEIEKLEISSNA